MLTQITTSDILKITSGQVIIDLKSVLKELIDNSIDAHSSKIEINYKNYGLDSLEINDDGDGILEHDFEHIALRSFTSKISNFEDLATVKTLGFRGEAINSLCSISSVKITTTTVPPKAYSLEFNHSGKLISKSVCSRPKGTTVSITNLFENLPVRKKQFLKNHKRDFNTSLSLIQRYALISTDVKFLVYNQNSKGRKALVLSTQGNKTIDRNIIDVFGSSGLKGLVPISLEIEHFKITGYISNFSFGFGRNSTDRQFVYINKRPIQYGSLIKIINEVYKSFNNLQFPVVIINIEMDPTNFDINITPDKSRIMMHNEDKFLESFRERIVETFQQLDLSLPRNITVKKETEETPNSVNILKNLKSSIPKRPLTLEKFEGFEDLESNVPKFRKRTRANLVHTKIGNTEAMSDILVNRNDRINLQKAVNKDNDVTLQARGASELDDGQDDDSDDEQNDDQDDDQKQGQKRKSEQADSELVKKKNTGKIVEPNSEEADEEISDNTAGRELQQQFDLEKSGKSVPSIAESSSEEESQVSTVVRENYKSNEQDEVETQSSACDIRISSEAISAKILSENIPGSRTPDSETEEEPLTSFPEPVKPQIHKVLKKINQTSRKRIDSIQNYSTTVQLPETFVSPKHESENPNNITDLKIDDITNEKESESFLSLTISKDDFKKMKVIGQFNLGFILVIRTSGSSQDLFIVDQHASDEKYNFEKLQKETVFESQPLVAPKFLGLSILDEMAVTDNQALFLKNGFKLKVDDSKQPGNKVSLTSKPLSKKTIFDESDFMELIHLIKDSPNHSSIRCSKIRSMFAMRACRKSIMIGKPLSMKTMTTVVRNLGELDKPWNCPHGRPTMRHLMDLQQWETFHDDYVV